MKPYLSILIVVLFCCSVQGQSYLYNSPVSMAQGGVSSTLSDVWSPMQNPAGTAAAKKLQTGISYIMPFGMKDLSTQSISATLASDIGNWGFYYQTFGFSLYREHNVGFGYAKDISPNFSAGFQINYCNHFSRQSGSGGQLYSSAGIQFLPLDELKIGATLINPEKASLNINGETIDIPSYYMLGVSWFSSEHFTLSYEFEKQNKYDAISKLGIEYKYKDFLWLRGGLMGKSINYSFGVGLKIRRFIIDYAAYFHKVLGMTSNIALTINWK